MGLPEVKGLDVTGGTIDTDVTWTISDSPIMVQGSLKVASGIKLKVMPGVVVVMADGSFLEVKGRLEAVGSGTLPITIGSATLFDRINVTQGGNATLEHVAIQNSTRGLFVESPTSRLMLKNSSVQSGGSGVTAQSNAEAWVVSCRFQATRNVTVSSAKVHEGNWLFYRAFRDDNLKGYPGVELEVTATKPQSHTWTVFDSKTGDPKTNNEGKLPPIMVEQYLHEGSSSGLRIMFQMRMWEKTWFKTEYPLYMGQDMFYNWSLDLTPPSSPFNLTALARGDRWLLMHWDIGNVPDLKEFNLTYKMDWQADKDYTTITVPNTLRNHNLTGLVEEMLYDIKVNALDFGENPSPYFGPMKVRTLDLTPPEPPLGLELVSKGGTWANLKWKESPSFDVIGYKLFRNLTIGEADEVVEIADLSGRMKTTVNLTGLESEADHNILVVAYDDGEIPNLSNRNASIFFRTDDITPPASPELTLWFVDPPQYLPGTIFYNSMDVGLKGRIPNEDRNFVDVLVNDAEYERPEGVSRFSTDKGNFSFFIHLPEGASTIMVRGVDPSGNQGEVSNPVSIVVDTTPPEIEIWQKGPTDLIVDKDETFILNCSVSDPSGIHSVNWIVSAQGFLREFEGGSVELDLPVGEYTGTCSVTDMAGNTNSDMVTIRSMVPDTVVPSVTGSYPLNGSKVRLDIEMWVSFSESLDWSQLMVSLNKVGTVTTQIGTSVELDINNLTVKVLLRENLEDSAEYRLTVGNIYDLRGNKALDHIISFTTVSKEEIDSDGDGIPDYFEVLHISFLSPSDRTDAAKDRDKDGLTNLEEYTLGTDLEDPDSDKDGMDDGWEVGNGLNPLSNGDALMDKDGDDYSNLDEYKAGTDPADPKDYPGSSGDDKVPLWLMILGVAVIVLLIGVIIGSLVIFSRRAGKKEGIPNERTVEEVVSGPVEAEVGQLDECPECGTPLEEGVVTCPVCGIVVETTGDEGNDGLGQPLDGHNDQAGPEVGELDDESLVEDGMSPLDGAVPPDEDEVS
jgi:hypothetical protein